MLAESADRDIQILDIRDMVPHLEASDVDKLFAGLHKSQIWGIIIGDTTKLTEPLWNALEVQFPKNVLYLGVANTNRNKKGSKRQKGLLAFCVANRRRAPESTTWTADYASRREFLIETQHLFSTQPPLKGPMCHQRNRLFRKEQ